MTDLSQVSTDDLMAYREGRLSDVTTEGLLALRNVQATTQPVSQAPAQGADAVDRGFVGDIKDIYETRRGAWEEVGQAADAGEIGPIQEVYQKTGKAIVPGVSEVAGRTGLEILKTVSPLPEFIEEGAIDLAGRAVGGIVRGVAELPPVQSAIQEYGELDRNVQRNIEAGTNIGLTGAELLGLRGLRYADDIVEATPNVARSAGDMVSQAPPVKAVGDVGKQIEEGAGDIFRGFKARKPDEIRQGIEDAGSVIGQTFEKVTEGGSIIHRAKAKKMHNNIKNSLKLGDTNRPSVKNLHKDLLLVLDDLEYEIGLGNFGLDKLHYYRKQLRSVDLKNKINNPDAAKKARDAIKALDGQAMKLKQYDFQVGGPEQVDALMEGIQGWAKLKRMDTIADIIEEAGGKPDKIKAGFKRLSKSDKKMYGFNEDERKMIKALGEVSSADDFAKSIGQFGIDVDNVSWKPLLASGMFGTAGFIVGGPGGLSLLGAGTAFRQGRKLATRGKAEDILKMVEDRPAFERPDLPEGPLPEELRLPSPQTMRPVDPSEFSPDYAKSVGAMEPQEIRHVQKKMQVERVSTEKKLGSAEKTLSKTGVDAPIISGASIRPEVENGQVVRLLTDQSKKNFTADTKGVIKQLSGEELDVVLENRDLYLKNMKDMGLTWGDQKAIFKNEMRKKFAPVWDTLSDDQIKTINKQIDDAWKEQRKSLEQVIGTSLKKSKTLKEEVRGYTGDPSKPLSQMEEAFSNTKPIRRK